MPSPTLPAAEAAQIGAMHAADIAEQKYLCLETVRRSGRAVMTPVWFAVEDDAIYVGTFERTGKVKRLRHTSRVRIAVCDSRGRPQGEWQQAEAAIAGGGEAAVADELLKRKYGLMKRLVDAWYRRKWGEEVIIRIWPGTAPEAVDRPRPPQAASRMAGRGSGTER